MTAPHGALARCTRVDARTFAAEHWSRTPLLSRGKELPAPFDDLLQVADVDELVADRALRTPFFRTVREGSGLPLPVRTATAGNRRIGDLVDPEALREQHAGGATLVLQSLHRMHPPIARFCRQLAEELGHATQCNAYVTPAGDAQGFDFHHDTHDVFVLQISGRKRWIVHEPVLRLPLPSQPRSGSSLVTEGAEPLLDVELEPGDALYLPRGYVHAALTTDQHSVHLTVGVLTTTWMDVLDDAVALAAREEGFRAALPVHPTSVLDDVPGFLTRAAEWLAQLPADEVRDRLKRRLQRAVPPEPLGLLAGAAALAGLAPDTRLRPRRGLPVELREGDDLQDDGRQSASSRPDGSRPDGSETEGRQVDGRASLHLPGRVVRLPRSTVPALRVLLAGPCAVADLAVGGLDVEDALVLARRMLREGVSVPA